MRTVNRIEATHRSLVAAGRGPLKLFPANPNDEGIVFPGEILADCYARYFRGQEYKPDPKGLRVAREAISGYYSRHGASADPENVVLTSGTSESFFYLFSLLAEPGDNILTPLPSYPLFDEIARLAHVELRHYKLDEERGWAIDLDSIRNGINSRTRAIVIVSPHNPTGMVADAQALCAIAEIANRHGIPLICDEVFSEFYFAPGKFPRAMDVARPELCLALNGISKMFALPAMKCSWIVATGDHERVAKAIDRLEHIADTFLSCHYPIQLSLPHLFEHGREFLAQYRAEAQNRRALAVKVLRGSPGLRFHEPAGGFYMMLELVDSKWTDEDDCVCELMEKAGIFPHPGYFYDYERGIHLVISFLLDPSRMQDGLERLGREICHHST